MMSSRILFNESLSKHSTFGIGGPATCLIYPNNQDELCRLLKYTSNNKIPVIFIGSGSNLLVWDEGFKGIVITISKTFKKLQFKSDTIISTECGVMLGNMVKEALRKNICGLESLVGVPGTVGGALIMNAGAFGSEISNYFFEAKTMTLSGDIKIYKKNDIKFSYRHSTLPKDEILIEAIFHCKKGIPEKILKDKINASQSRKRTQPLKFRSAGSIFKNPSQKLAAGYLIDKAGLKGSTYGGASISEKHANFIINKGNATAKDVLNLIILIKKTITKKFNICLELEVKLIGFPDNIIKGIYHA